MLVEAGARIGSLAEAAAAGDVIDQLLAAGTPIDAADPWGRRPLPQARQSGRTASVEHLLTSGADPGDPS